MKFPDPNYSLSTAEKWAWAQICAGKVADMRLAPGSEGGVAHGRMNDKQDDASWKKRTAACTLSADFIALVATNRDFATIPGINRIHIESAVVNGKIELDRKEIKLELWLHSSLIASHIGIVDAWFHQNLSLNESVVGGYIEGQGAIFAKNFSLRKGHYSAVNLTGAKISRQLSTNGSVFSDLFQADGIEVSGGVFLQDAAKFEKDVRLIGAKINGQLVTNGSVFHGQFRADGIAVNGGVLLHDAAVFEQKIHLLGAKIGDQLALNGSTFKESFHADGIEVNGSVFLQKAVVFEMDFCLLGAKIGGQIAVTDATVKGRFIADDSEVNGSVFLSDGSMFEQEVRLFGAKIGGQLSVNASTFKGQFVADTIKVNGNVFLDDRSLFEQDVCLRSAKISGPLYATGSVFNGRFNADSIDVSGSVFLRDGSQFNKGIDLVNAKIVGSLLLNDSQFSGAVNLEGAQIVKSCVLYGYEKTTTNPKWQSGVIFILHNAHAGSLRAQMPESWLAAPEDDMTPHPQVNTDIVGFTYDKLDVQGALSQVKPEHLIDWIKNATPAGEYTPQPYTQLAKVLREAGAEDQAREVEIARFNHYYKTKKTWGARFWGGVRHFVDRYGLRPWRAAGFWGVLVLLGWVLGAFAFDPPASFSTAQFVVDTLQFSIENMLPFSSVFEFDKCMVASANPYAKLLFSAQKLLGFFLLAVLFRDLVF